MDKKDLRSELTPYVGFTNRTLQTQPLVKAGDLITCPRCHGRHALQADDNGGEVLLFYRCGDCSMLGAVKHRLIVDCKADVAGHVDLANSQE